MGAVAITLLLAGGLDTLQQAAVVAGAPFALVMIGIAVSLVKALREEEGTESPARTVTIPEPPAPRPSPSPAGGRRWFRKGDTMAERQQRFHGLSAPVAERGRMRDFGGAGAAPPQESRTHATAWIPRMDLFADDDDLVIRCELSGVTR